MLMGIYEISVIHPIAVLDRLFFFVKMFLEVNR